MKLLKWFFVFLLIPLFVRANGAQFVQTIDDPTILRSGPSEDYDRIAEVPKGIRFEVITTQKNWFKVRVSSILAGWIDSKSLKTTSKSSASHPVLKYIKIEREKNDVRMDILESEPGVVITEEWLRPTVLWLKFQNTQAALSELDYDPKDSMIQHVSVWQEFEDVVFVRIDLKALYGYQIVQKDPEHLLIKFQLKPHGAGLRAWTICIDPGHGGKDTGAIGPTKFMEKAATLSISKMLGSLLESRGAKVVYTRTSDISLVDPEAPILDELKARVDAARSHDANLFISVHCNARPTTAEGRLARGSYVYYFQPHSYALAHAISERLEKQIEEPKYGVIFRSFHVIRESDFPAILVETAFISNPITEAKLREKRYQARIARGIFQGVLNYAKSTAAGGV